MHDEPGDPAHQGFHQLAIAEDLLARAERDATAAEPAARAAVRSLLLFWGVPAADEDVPTLLRQANETDPTLEDLAALADELRNPTTPDARRLAAARTFVDAARARLATI